MLASLEIPLLGEDTTAVARFFAFADANRGTSLFPPLLPAAGDWGTFRGRVPSQRLGTCRAVLALTLTLTPAARARVRCAPPGCRVTRLCDGRVRQPAAAWWVVLPGDWLAERGRCAKTEKPSARSSETASRDHRLRGWSRRKDWKEKRLEGKRGKEPAEQQLLVTLKGKKRWR